MSPLQNLNLKRSPKGAAAKTSPELSMKPKMEQLQEVESVSQKETRTTKATTVAKTDNSALLTRRMQIGKYKWKRLSPSKHQEPDEDDQTLV